MMQTILIVEDNDLNQKLFADVLQVYGYAVLQARDGKQGLAMARTHHPDLILMDVQLPEMSGLDVTRLLKGDQDTRGIPIIALTAFAMKGDEEKVRDAGCNGYMSKPIRIHEFLELVKHYTGHSAAAA
jgi:two-component system, cell cycle response regulator DivK